MKSIRPWKHLRCDIVKKLIDLFGPLLIQNFHIFFYGSSAKSVLKASYGCFSNIFQVLQKGINLQFLLYLAWKLKATNDKRCLQISLLTFVEFDPLSFKPTKWSNTLKQFVGFCWRIVWVCLTILWGCHLKD